MFTNLAIVCGPHFVLYIFSYKVQPHGDAPKVFSVAQIGRKWNQHTQIGWQFDHQIGSSKVRFNEDASKNCWYFNLDYLMYSWNLDLCGIGWIWDPTSSLKPSSEGHLLPRIKNNLITLALWFWIKNELPVKVVVVYGHLWSFMVIWCHLMSFDHKGNQGRKQCTPSL